MNILNILKRYADENHRLSQREIAGIPETEYGMAAEQFVKTLSPYMMVMEPEHLRTKIKAHWKKSLQAYEALEREP